MNECDEASPWETSEKAGEEEEAFDLMTFQRNDLFQIGKEDFERVLEDDDYDSDNDNTTHAPPASQSLVELREDDCDQVNSVHNYDEDEVRDRNAIRHFNTYMANCSCENKCTIPNMKVLTKSFAKLRETDRSNCVRSMMMVLTAPSSGVNELSKDARTAKRRRTREGTQPRSSVVYAMKGIRLCRAAFSAIVQVHPRTVNGYAETVVNVPSFNWLDSGKTGNRKNKRTTQSVVAVSFLHRYGDLNALSCPTAPPRGSSEEATAVIRWLPTTETKDNVYKAYEKSWAEILSAIPKHTSIVPRAPLTKGGFLNLWRLSVPMLRILRSGSEFCDFCTTMASTITNTAVTCVRSELQRSLYNHRKQARNEFVLYMEKTTTLERTGDIDELHLTFDFAEAILLPHLLKQPGQLHFVSALRNDLFAVHSSNLKTTFVFSLPEGHWPQQKTANEVISMLLYNIEWHKKERGFVNTRMITLHADNCAVQNKNKYMLWFLSARLLMGDEDSINFLFPVAGHTKNRCDSAFGLVKRKLKQRDVLCPSAMMAAVNDSSSSTDVVSATAVQWMDFKSILSEFFTIPVDFKLSMYHCFYFTKDKPGWVTVKEVSTSTEVIRFSLLKSNLTVPEVITGLRERYSSPDCYAPIITLDSIPSTHEGNRKAYLMKEVVKRHYSNDALFEKRYFSSGSDWDKPEPIAQ